MRSSCVAKQTTAAYAFLLLALLFTYPLISDIFWWGWGMGTALEVLFFCCYLCFGFAPEFWLTRFRWGVWSVLFLTVLLVTPEALLPMPFEWRPTRLWLLRATLACCVFLLV